MSSLIHEDQTSTKINEMADFDLFLNSENPQKVIDFLKNSNNAKTWLVAIFHYYSAENQERLREITRELSLYVNQNSIHFTKQRLGFIYILDILTLFFTFLSQKSIEKSDFTEMTNFSTQLINLSERIDFTNSLTLIAKGYLFYSRGEYDTSEITFQNAFEKESNSLNSNIIILSIIGLTLNCVIKMRFSDAITHLTNLIKKYNFYEEFILEILGICYYNIGKEEKAFHIFKKTLILNNNNFNALCYLSIMELNKGSSSQFAFDQALKMLLSSFDILVNSIEFEYSTSCHLILNNIITFLLINENFDIIEDIKKRLNLVIEQSVFKYLPDKKGIKNDGDKLKSILHCLNGKVFHMKKVYNEALYQYSKAINLNQLNIEAQFGCGQIHFFNKNYQEALKCFEACSSTQDFSALFEVNKFIAIIKSKLVSIYKSQSFEIYNSKIEELNNLFNQLLDIKPDEIDCIIELARINEYKNPEYAIELYEKLLKLLDSNKVYNGLYSKTDVYPEILNNLSSLKILLKKKDESILNNLKKAHKIIYDYIQIEEMSIKANPDSHDKDSLYKLKAMEISIIFNIGLYYELINNLGEAYKIYKSIKSNNPFFVDAYSKLGILSYYRGNIKKAIEYLNLSIDIHYENKEKKQVFPCLSQPLNPMLIKSVIQNSFVSPLDALQTLSKIMEIDTKDPYTLILIGNINYDLAFQSRSSGGKTGEYFKRITKALEFYYAALSIDNQNSYAAIGIGNIFAEFDNTSTALDIYKSVSDKLHYMYSKNVNEALLYINEGKFSKAISLLAKTINSIKTKETYFQSLHQFELILSKAYIENGDYDQGLYILKGLIFRFPDNITYRFNYSIGLYLKANGIFSNNMSKVKDLIEAKECLERAIPLLESINKIRKEQKIYMSPDQEKLLSTGDFIYKLNDSIDICTSLLRGSVNKIEEAKVKELKEIKVLEENAKKYQEMLSSKKQMEKIEFENILQKKRENEEKIDSYKQKAIKIVTERRETIKEAKVKKVEQQQEVNSVEDEKRNMKKKRKEKGKGKKKREYQHMENEEEVYQSDGNDLSEKEYVEELEENYDNEDSFINDNLDEVDDGNEKDRNNKKKGKLNKKTVIEDDFSDMNFE